jgi:hypothetical protein
MRDGSVAQSLRVDKGRRVGVGALVGGASWHCRLGRSSATTTVEKIAEFARVGNIPDTGCERLTAWVGADGVKVRATLKIRTGKSRRGEAQSTNGK